MTHIVSIIADPQQIALDPAIIATLSRHFGTRPRWLAEAEAAEFTIEEGTPASIGADIRKAFDGEAALEGLDLCITPAVHRLKRLLISDMDSTMITVECIDELADFANVKPEVAAITARAMAGELNFESALRARVALLEGLPVTVFDQVYRERVRLMPGAATLVATMHAKGAVTALVSGGFVPFAERVQKALGFDVMTANHLEIHDQRLTGRVLDPIAGPDRKLAMLQQLTRAHDLSSEATIAVGDGANDLPMLQAAGLGVAFHAYPSVARAAKAKIDVANLTALLYLQGIPQHEFIIA